MKHHQFNLSSEQTLRLAELRDALAKVLPREGAEKVEFPTARYDICNDCHTHCQGACVSCTGTCVQGCATVCAATCGSDCVAGC
jgi:hypothetical protein